MTDRPLVLLTNDDGFDSRGIRALHESLRHHYNIVVAAPRTQQSGIGHAFTFSTPLRYEKSDTTHGSMPGYIIHGTPSDCVKFSVSHILSERPNIVVSGMNIGENSGISAFYSGTVAAAREGAFWNILSVAFSVEERGAEYLDQYCSIAGGILERLAQLENQTDPPRHRAYYNVNFPACDPAECKGIRVTRQSLAFFDDRYRLTDSHQGKKGYEIYGEKKNLEKENDFDSRALLNNYITVTPLDYDATAERALPGIATLEEVSPNDARRKLNA